MTLLTLCTSGLAATLTVGPTRSYTTINAAVSAAASGDTISVDPGTYAEDLDLRGLSLSVVSTSGPARTTISPTTSIQIDGGSLEGFRIDPAPSTAVLVSSGSPTLRELEVLSPSSYGVQVSAGSPVVEEVVVFSAGIHAFIVRGGTPTLRRNVSYGATQQGYSLKAASTVSNCIAIGGAYGFVWEAAESTMSHCVVVGASAAATGAIYSSTVTNSAFRDNGALLQCWSATPTFTNGIAYSGTSTTSCSGSPTSAVTEADPGFTSWSASAEFYTLDLRPISGSAMVDAGSGTDTDGSAADYGAFGGPDGDWTDRDGDGWVVIFDCDDHNADTYTGATEVADGQDNDCDDFVDEDIPVDTGPIDTGPIDTGPIDTGPVDTGPIDTGPIDTGPIDTGPGESGNGPVDDTGSTTVPNDLDRDGYAADVDCGEHNIATYPGARELTDGADNDCDGYIDEGTAAGDDDGDTFTELGGDCDDTDPTRFPGADDDNTGSDGVDHDCDGLDDLAVGQDRDGDGHYDNVDDCDDTNPESYTGSTDPTNGVDEDCDGLADDDDLRSDRDADGVTPEDGDCNDGDPLVYRGNTDIPDDFVDQDCTGEDNYDVDRDGDASPTSGGTDCDDNNSTINPAHAETCDDLVDNDCDEVVDEDCESSGGKTPTGGGCGCAALPGGGLPASAALLAFAVLLRRRNRGLRS